MAEDLRRLFEQGGDETPVLTRRVAWGLVGTVTKNSTWQTIVTWLQGVLNFLRPANNLSDVADAAVALSNLGGINSGTLSGYALKSNVLELNNTVEFTPDNPYEPATKNYVDTIYYSGDNTTEALSTSGLDLDVYCITNPRLHLVQMQIQFNTDGFDGSRSVQIGGGIAPFPKTTILFPAVSGAGTTAIIGVTNEGLLTVGGQTVSGIDYRAFVTYMY